MAECQWLPLGALSGYSRRAATKGQPNGCVGAEFFLYLPSALGALESLQGESSAGGAGRVKSPQRQALSFFSAVKNEVPEADVSFLL